MLWAASDKKAARLFMLFSSDHVKTFLGIPLWLENERLFVAESEYQTKMWKVRGVDAPATRMRGSQGPSVYAYRFEWDEESSDLNNAKNCNY